MCQQLMVQGTIGTDEVRLQLCTCQFPQDDLTTTTDVKDGHTVRTEVMRLTALGETEQSLRQLFDNLQLIECLPPGGTLFFHFT